MNPENDLWKTIFIYIPVVLGFHVDLQGSTRRSFWLEAHSLGCHKLCEQLLAVLS